MLGCGRTICLFRRFGQTGALRSVVAWRRRNMRLTKALPVLVSAVLVGSILIAQVSTSTILGTITDQSGAAMAGVQVTVRDLGTAFEYVLNTGADGNYIAENLKPGQYQVSASKPGFKETVLQGINVLVGQRARLDI